MQGPHSRGGKSQKRVEDRGMAPIFHRHAFPDFPIFRYQAFQHRRDFTTSLTVFVSGIYCNHSQHPPFSVFNTVRHQIPVLLSAQENPNQCVQSNRPISSMHSENGMAIQHHKSMITSQQLAKIGSQYPESISYILKSKSQVPNMYNMIQNLKAHKKYRTLE